mmetsp:Transcript_85743/g.239757  ORF Transcript_85743/g.239757 Transcript_85743/m.239757 type:complete len:211 (-) Transcript_85743:174-806(-)
MTAMRPRPWRKLWAWFGFPCLHRIFRAFSNNSRHNVSAGPRRRRVNAARCVWPLRSTETPTRRFLRSELVKLVVFTRTRYAAPCNKRAPRGNRGSRPFADACFQIMRARPREVFGVSRNHAGSAWRERVRSAACPDAPPVSVSSRAGDFVFVERLAARDAERVVRTLLEPRGHVWSSHDVGARAGPVRRPCALRTPVERPFRRARYVGKP